MTLTLQTIEPVIVDVSNEADWYVEFEDLDDDTGAANSHAGKTLRMDVRANDDSILFTATSSDYISLKPGSDHVIVVNVPWNVVKDIVGGEYVGTIVWVKSVTSREIVLPVIFRQHIGPTRTS
jgi:hypothetical protein